MGGRLGFAGRCSDVPHSPGDLWQLARARDLSLKSEGPGLRGGSGSWVSGRIQGISGQGRGDQRPRT